MERFFGAGLAGEGVELWNTRLGQRARETQLVVKPRDPQVQREARDAKIQFLAEQARRIYDDRSEAEGPEGGLKFNVARNRATALQQGRSVLQAEDLTLHWPSIGLPFGSRDRDDSALSKALTRDLDTVMAGQNQFATGFIYEEGSTAQLPLGLMSNVSLNDNARPAYRVAAGDVVLMRLDSFKGDFELAKKRVRWMADHGAIVLLGDAQGQTDLRAELAAYLLDELQYEPVSGSKHVYQPGDFGSRFQNQKARISSLTETRPITAKNRAAILLARGLNVQENALYVNPDTEALGSVAVSATVLPTSAMFGFNVPVTDPQIQETRAKLRRMGQDDASRQLLRDQSNSHIKEPKARAAADAEFDKDFDELLQRFGDTDGVLPPAGARFGKGSLIPLVDNTGRILLYRHGYKALSRFSIDEQAALTLPGRHDPERVATFPSKPESTATVPTGEVVSFEPRASRWTCGSLGFTTS